MARTKPNTKEVVRLSLDLDEGFHKRLTDLGYMTHTTSKADVIRMSLQISEFVARKTLEGYKFLIVDPDGKEESCPFFGSYVALREPNLQPEPEPEPVMA